MIKISIIIPVFNTEQYISDCIESILAQTFKDFEAIFVDDGSEDDSYAIISKYVNLDSRIKVYHQNNAGVSAARNLGLAKASGEYIAFIDSDDTISPDYLQQLYLGISSTSADIVMSGIIGVSNGIETYRGVLDERTISLDSEACLLSFFNTYFLPSPVAKLYKYGIISSYGMHFDVNLSYAEDRDFNLMYFQHIRIASILSFCGYFYRDVNNSLSKKRYDYKFLTEYKHWAKKRAMFESLDDYGEEGRRYLVNQLFYIVSDELSDAIRFRQSIKKIIDKRKRTFSYLDFSFLRTNYRLLNQPFWVKFLIWKNCFTLLLIVMWVKKRISYGKAAC